MMKRITVAAIAIPVLVIIIFLAPVWALGIVVGAIAACSAWELLRCADRSIKKRMMIYAAASAFCIPFFSSLFDGGTVYEITLFALFAVMFCELMLSFRKEETMSLSTVTLTLLAGGIMPVLLTAIVRLGLRDHGSVYALLPLVAAFSSDSGAFFAGTYLGRHALAPRLSPHKTIEGSIGGFVSAIALMLVYGLVLKAVGYKVDLPVMCAYGFLGLACQLGDLAFSAIKRLSGVKDYGDLIPGHGGMLDRFDSMYWTAAFIEILVCVAPAITRAAAAA